ncbi:type A chloramphenicol O-acetyltransferase [Paenibacillus sp. FSL A5-0031]|uniref:type A chloramphenicol O-acetyltransferase n=1 Tax=Paenibacillus sp. FSL A5-0031 TaxID=1920420 RepID=UPI00096EF967|nr:type A chloramphenicol O-acetyltransferase [Paenibacillus sp. FSL A5-0031]OME76914.1 type A chloramphenicol O-acetyltransferase [Paenibacillus sp. FSL A5-0031]
MKFNPIVMDNWSRKPYFEHYLNNVRCTFSMTANIDISRLLKELKIRGIKLYPALIHMITTVVNRHDEFRTCFHADGTLGYWDRLSPSFTIFHDDDKTFSSIWTLYSEDFNDFYSRYLDDMKKYGSVKQFAAKTNEPPGTVPISSIPWVSFTGFNLNIYNEGNYLLPIFTMGKYFHYDDKILLPLSGQFHHAVCDGYHAGMLYNELQLRADACTEWLPNYTAFS